MCDALGALPLLPGHVACPATVAATAALYELLGGSTAAVPPVWPMVLHGVWDPAFAAGVAAEATAAAALVPAHIFFVRRCRRDLRLRGTHLLRRVLSLPSPPVQQVIDAGGVADLAACAMQSDDGEMQFEALWALTNIASGTSAQTQAVLAVPGLLPAAVAALRSQNVQVVEQAAWLIGNAAGDGCEARDACLAAGALPPLLEVGASAPTLPSCRANVTWTISNLCRGKPRPQFNRVSPALPLLISLLTSHHTDTVMDAAWALSYLSDGSNDEIEVVVQAGAAPDLVALMRHPDPKVVTPALRAVGNLCTGTTAHTQLVLDLGGLRELCRLMASPRPATRKEVCWVLSNIAADSSAMVGAMVRAGAIPRLVNAAASTDAGVAKEAVWALANAAENASATNKSVLVGVGATAVLSGALRRRDDPRLLKCALEGLGHLVGVPQDRRCIDAIVTAVAALVDSEDDGVKQRAVAALKSANTALAEANSRAKPTAVANGAMPALGPVPQTILVSQMFRYDSHGNPVPTALPSS